VNTDTDSLATDVHEEAYTTDDTMTLAYQIKEKKTHTTITD